MALIICTECNKEISENAEACPNCGNPIDKEYNNLTEDEKKQSKEIEEYIEGVWWKGFPVFVITKFTGVFGQLIIGFILAMLLGLVMGVRNEMIAAFIAFFPWFYINKFSTKATVIITWGLYIILLIGGILNLLGYLD